MTKIVAQSEWAYLATERILGDPEPVVGDGARRIELAIGDPFALALSVRKLAKLADALIGCSGDRFARLDNGRLGGVASCAESTEDLLDPQQHSKMLRANLYRKRSLIRGLAEPGGLKLPCPS